MHKFLSISIISLKLFFLFCISGMGDITFASEDAEVLSPCHEESTYQETQSKDCNQCLKSIQALEGKFVSQEEASLKDLLFAVELSKSVFIDGFVSLKDRSSIVYRPPPGVILANAQYHPKKTIVLVI